MASNGKSLLEAINDHLSSSELRLPVYSAVASELQSAVANPACSIDRIESLLMQDMGLSSHVLRIANSSFYAGLGKAKTVTAAIHRLGLKQVVDIAVMCSQREHFRSGDTLVAGYVERLWRHSVNAAFGARWIAERGGFRDQASEAFLAGLFHDIGTLLLLKVIEQIRSSNGAQHVPEHLVSAGPEGKARMSAS